MEKEFGIEKDKFQGTGIYTEWCSGIIIKAMVIISKCEVRYSEEA